MASSADNRLRRLRMDWQRQRSTIQHLRRQPHLAKLLLTRRARYMGQVRIQRRSKHLAELKVDRPIANERSMSIKTPAQMSLAR
jgi:hypothetical protein